MTSVNELQSLLGLEKPPIAIGYLDTPPPGVKAWDGGAVPAGCVFWKKAQEGNTFYTVPADHYNCAVGAYTHKVPLPAERAAELGQTIEFMVESRYLAMEEVPGIPTLASTPAIIAYAPLDKASFAPDVVVVAAQPAQAMLLYEAALKAGVGSALTNTLGRPACAALPLTLQSGATALSLGCKGNRVYTGLPDSEMYVAVPGDKWEAVAQHLAETLRANQAIETHHLGRKAAFAS